MDKTRPDRASDETARSASRRALAIAALVIFLLLVAVGVDAWWSLRDTEMTASGYVALALGIFATVCVGVALMGLLFYSHRHGYDEAAGGEKRNERD